MDRAGGAPAAIQINFLLLASLTVLITLTPYSVDAFLPGFPAASHALGAGTSTMQLTLTAYLLGIAGGQLIFGPLSDRFGRRGPLIVGAAVCALASVMAALAPTIGVLIAARLVQGIAGSAAMVICKAIIRDRSTGGDTTHFLAMTAVGSGALNIFAPLIGGLLNAHFGWRGPLWFIAAIATLMLLLVIVVVPETHAVEHREQRNRWLGLPSVVRHLRNRTFLVYVVIQAGSYGTLMAYVSSSPFVYQNVLGFDASAFGLLFSINAACGVAANFVANRFLRGLGAKRLVMWGLGLSMTGTVLTATMWAVGAPVAAIAACITLSMAPLGLNGPNLVGLALNTVTRAVGSAAATIGFVQFVTGSLVSPLVGLWGPATLVPTLVVMFALTSFSMVFLLVSRRSERGIQAAAVISGG